MELLTPNDRPRVVAIHAAVFAALVGRAILIFTFPFWRGSIGDPHIASVLAAWAPQALLAVLPILVALAFYLVWRRREPHVAFHSLQALYWQLLCQLAHWAVDLGVIVQLIVLESPAGAVVARLMWISFAVGIIFSLANASFVARAAVFAILGKGSRYPFVSRLARAITVGLPLPR